MSKTSVERQLERILDEVTGKQVDVIVQMKSDGPPMRKLATAAGEALSRRRMSLTPRNLLPGTYRKPLSRKAKQETASTRMLLGRVPGKAVPLGAIQKLGTTLMQPLLKSGLVQTVLAQMAAPVKKGAKPKPVPSMFWTSRALPLRMKRDDLARLPKEVANIKSVYVNRRLKVPALTEAEPLRLETEDLLSAAWGLQKIRAPAVWGIYGTRGQGVKIGLLDTGVDPTHPDLKDKVIAWAEFDSGGDPVPSGAHDSGEHGTHCAGTLVGGDASGRHIGVAPEARLAAALVIDSQQGGTDAQVLAGIDWAVEQGVDVISMSLGGLVMDAETPPTYTQAILTCMEAGIPVVAAIGNEGEQTTGSPGNDLFALSVGATDCEDRVAGFSGGRTQIIYESDFIDDRFLPMPYSKPDLTAPGVAIYSSVPGDDWKSFSGTSMATPHVAGAIALLLAATTIAQKESGIARTALLQDLTTGAVEDLGECGQDHRYGFGRLDLLRAVDFARQRGY